MNYDRYRIPVRGWPVLLLVWAGISGGFAYFFFRDYVAFLLFLLFFPCFVRIVKNKCKNRRLWNLKVQFADALMGMSTALGAGNSVENAFRKVYVEMKSTHGEASDIARELEVIVRGMENNITVEALLTDFGNRCRVDEIVTFADVFSIGKRSGGNLKEIMEICCTSIAESVEMQREFRIQLSSRRFEMQIMALVPFAILIYIGKTSAGYFDGMYHSMPGMAVMGVCLAVYLIAYWWGMKIIENSKKQ